METEEKNKGGRPTDFKEEYCEKIVELAESMNLYQIANELGVSVKGMWGWSKRYDTFGKAYARVKTIRGAKLMKWAYDHIDDRNANPKLLDILFRYDCGLSDQRAVAVKDISKGNHSDRAKRILEEVESGEFNADEIQKLINSLGTLAKIDEVTELRDKVKEFQELSKKGG